MALSSVNPGRRVDRRLVYLGLLLGTVIGTGTLNYALSDPQLPPNAAVIALFWGQSNNVVSGTSALSTTPSADDFLVRARTLQSTAWSRASNVTTVTLATDHKLVPGMLITFDTVTATGDHPTQTAVVSVASTSFTFNHVAANASATELGTIVADGTPVPLREGLTESPMSGFAAKLDDLDPGRRVYAIGEAVGGTPYSGLAQGTVPYNRMIASAQVAIADCIADGIPYEIAIFASHGEQDNQAGVDGPTYQGFMEELVADVSADLGERVRLFQTQQQNWPKSGTGATTTVGTVALGQKSAAEANTDIYHSHSLGYHVFQTSGNNIHITAEGARRSGEEFARAYWWSRIAGRGKWQQLHISRAVATGPTIVVDFEGGEGSALTIDTTNLTQRLNTRGLEYVDGTASPAGIVSVALTGNRQATITLNKDAAASGVVEVAYAAGYNANLGLAVTSIGPASNIRESMGEASLNDVLDLFSWASTERRALDAFTAVGITAPAWANTNSARTPAANGSWLTAPRWSAATGLTRAVWCMDVRRDTSWPTGLIWWEVNDSVNGRLYSFRSAASGVGQFFIATNDTTFMNYQTPASTFAGNTWYQICPDYDGSATGNDRFRLYVNGTDVTVGGTVGTYSATPPASLPNARPSPMAIFAGSNGASFMINANGRDFAFWPVGARPSGANFATYYNGGTRTDPALAPWGAPTHHYRMETDFCDYGTSATPRHLHAMGPSMTINGTNP